jgi:hypothetical protein
VRAAQRYVAPLAIYALTRALDVVFVLVTAPGRMVKLELLPGAFTREPASSVPTYWEVMTSWDGQFYWQIADHGYPGSALGPDGHPIQTPLAFFPVFPMLVRGVSHLTGLSFPVAAPLLAVLLGAAAICVVYRLVETTLGRRSALIAVALLCCFVSAPILQAAYTESMALLLVATALLFLHRRRYVWALAPILLLGLTRNVAPAMAAVVVLHWVVRARARSGPALTRGDHAALGGLLVAVGVATVEWPLIVWRITGERTAYFDTMSAWAGFTGSIFKPPIPLAIVSGGALPIALCLAFLVLFVTFMLLPSSRRWGPELWGWGLFYPLYLFGAAGASPSWIRYLVLAFPLGLLLAPQVRSERSRRWQDLAVLACCTLGMVAQYVWIDKYLVFAGPHGGWSFP